MSYEVRDRGLTMTYLKDFLGVPVMVQLKMPLVGIAVYPQKQTLPVAAAPTEQQWVPRAFMVKVDPKDPESPQEPVTTQLIELCTIHETDQANLVEIRWLAPHTGGRVAQIGTLVDNHDIAAITRVIAIEEPSSILLR
jgi:hypothetical protein